MFCTFCAVEKFYILVSAASTVKKLIANYCVIKKRARLITHFSITLLPLAVNSDNFLSTCRIWGAVTLS